MGLKYEAPFEDRIEAFLAKLSMLSVRHGVTIEADDETGKPSLLDIDECPDSEFMQSYVLDESGYVVREIR